MLIQTIVGYETGDPWDWCGEEAWNVFGVLNKKLWVGVFSLFKMVVKVFIINCIGFHFKIGLWCGSVSGTTNQIPFDSHTIHYSDLLRLWEEVRYHLALGQTHINQESRKSCWSFLKMYNVFILQWQMSKYHFVLLHDNPIHVFSSFIQSYVVVNWHNIRRLHVRTLECHGPGGSIWSTYTRTDGCTLGETERSGNGNETDDIWSRWCANGRFYRWVVKEQSKSQHFSEALENANSNRKAPGKITR